MGIWMSFTYVWRVLINTFYLALTILILSSSYSSFEQLVLCLLLGIGVSVQYGFASSAYSKIQLAVKRQSQFIRITELLSDNNIGQYQDDLKDTIQSIRPYKIKYWINAAFTSITSLYILWKILQVIKIF